MATSHKHQIYVTMDYVIIDKSGCPLRWQSDLSIVIYGSYEAAMEDYTEGDTLVPFDEYEGAL